MVSATTDKYIKSNCYALQDTLCAFNDWVWLCKILQKHNFRYATFAPKVKTLSAEIERLNSIIRKGGEIWWQSVKNIEEMLSATTVPTSSQAAQIIQLCGKV